MINIYYKDKGHTIGSTNVGLLDELGYDDILWIDLNSPEGNEKRGVEDFLGTTLQTRAQAEEIESSSRYSETEGVIYTNTNFLIPGHDAYHQETVSFILAEGILVTVRNSPLRSFQDIERRLLASYHTYPTGYHLMISILENRIDLDADIIEILSKEIAQLSKRIGLGEKVNEEILLEINQMQENTMIIRENITDKQRIISSILKSDKFPRDVYTKLNVLVKDVGSLINHTDFSFERLEYLQNTVLGLINLDQNKIISIFTVVTVFFMPPTLIASMYGMNLFLPLIDNGYDLVIAILLMLISVLLTFFYFRSKRLL